MNVLCGRAFSGHQAGSSARFLGQGSAEILRRASESPQDLEEAGVSMPALCSSLGDQEE